MASTAGLKGNGGGVAYVASKHGVVGLTQRAAVTYAKQGITINSICPGPVETELRIHSNEILSREFEKTTRVGSDEEDRSSQSPVGRVGKPEDIAAAACYLASRSAWYVNGLALSIDGGWAAM